MDKSKKRYILQIEEQVTKFFEEWESAKKTGGIFIEISMFEGGIRFVDVNENIKHKIK